MISVGSNLPACLLSSSALRLIKGNGNKLYNRVNAQGYKESPGDVQAASEIAEDIRDALLDYQASGDNAYAVVRPPKLGHLDR